MRDRDPIDQPCALCGQRVTGDAEDDHLHVVDMPQLDVRIVHHLVGGDAECCATMDPEMPTLLDEGCSDTRLLAAVRRVLDRGDWAWRPYYQKEKRDPRRARFGRAA